MYKIKKFDKRVLENIISNVKEQGFGHITPLENQNWVEFFEKNL